MIKISDLKTRDVVNILDGRKLGNIIDIDLDLENGRVTALILPGRSRGLGIFTRREELVIPWEKIIRIGRDVVLVEVPTVTEIEGRRRSYLLDEDDF
ncbi:sporulation protein, YlmC/YmxH family [Thermosyntropha lipolytica DSM 11003]|uniref:Sporulation protein, YlmC/YmxH family n=1 Tax=Thermosyntropha lipolytica DSM 11003 TaxID=1123382 RepID=A0A1M5K7V8_9FIRM|nr:YlmC/YmxH family sporulation protein [Thermosyntropha lipolytica]SHG48887.1 sporulation protein, YlmC/YmxH family [Thermosyntropha lipolytica DSM 11003]